MDSSIVSLLCFYPLSQSRFVYSYDRSLVSIVLVWIRPLLPIKLGFMAVRDSLCFDLFWHKKEAAASTVCLTGFPCHFFWFFPMTGSVYLFIFIVKILFWVVSGLFFHCSFADSVCPQSALLVSAILLPGQLR